METICKTQNITKKYGKFTALNKVSITINKGDIYGLVGKNGAGKTTMMKIITGITEATEGSFELFGTQKKLEEQRKKIGTIIETPEFFPYFNAKDNLEYFRIQRGILDKKVVNTVLEQVDLAHFEKKKFKQYSLGMKQRLGIALALMSQPDFLILDEPINGIDPEGIVELRQLFLRLNQEHKTTIMISSHILTELSNIVTRVAILDQGKLVEALSMAELKEKTGHYVELSVSDPYKTVALLETEFNYTNYKITKDNKILLLEGFDKIPEINKFLVGADIEVMNINRKNDSLEDYYLQLIGGKKDV